MKFSQYKDFDDFCIKNNMTPEQGLQFLDNELKGEGKHGTAQ